MATDDHELGAPDIEITPEMIQAGADTLRGFLIEDADEGHSTNDDRLEVAEMVLSAALSKAKPKLIVPRDVIVSEGL